MKNFAIYTKDKVIDLLNKTIEWIGRILNEKAVITDGSGCLGSWEIKEFLGRGYEVINENIKHQKTIM